MRTILFALIFSLSCCAPNSPSSTTASEKPSSVPVTRPNSDDPLRNDEPTQPKPTIYVDEAAQNLLLHQSEEFDRILAELNNQKKKTSHWIWWLFPTEMPGASEPIPKSSVSSNQAAGVLSKADMKKWTLIINTIASLLEANLLVGQPQKPNSTIIPSIDHGRIGYALDFWLRKVGDLTKTYPAFNNALLRLDQFTWK